MLRIEALTQRQQLRLAEFRDRWLAIGLSTAPAERERAETAIRHSYRCASLEPPRKIVWCGSPLSSGLTRAIILDPLVRASVRDSVWASVRDSVWDSVRASVGASVWASVVASVGASAYGQHDAGWLSFYEYLRTVAGLEAQTETLTGLIEHARRAGWAIPHAGICWVSDRHHVLNRDGRGRLHCLSGPAVAYPDGWSIYAVNGVRVPEYVIARPQEINVARIDAETNAEIRRVMIESYGASRFLIDAGAKPFSSDDFGTLYRREISGDEPVVMVKVVNSTPEPDGSLKDYFIRVDPNVKTAREAVAWTFGMQEREYQPEHQS